jgi:predicted transcriptional regulator
MILELTPEQQEILELAARSGKSQAEALDEAFTLLRQSLEMDAWLLANREDVIAQIEEGIASAERGELIPDYEVERLLHERKRRRQIA